MLQGLLDTEPSVRVKAFARSRPSFDPSSAFIFILAIFTVCIATWWSAEWERGCAMGTTRVQSQETTSAPEGGGGDETLGLKHVLMFLGCGSLVLVLLFAFMQYLYSVVVVMFCIAGANALNFVFAPALKRFVPYSKNTVPLPVWGDAPIASLIMVPVTFTISIIWYFNRDTPWAWLIQDSMAVSVCIFFLATIRLSSLKLAATLLGLALIYDVFWVYLSPYLFGGQSVMVAVATGQGKTSHSDSGGFQQPTLCIGGSLEPGTMLPMLILVPHFIDWAGGFNLLGLGDIVLPGLLLSYCLRIDYNLLYSAGSPLVPSCPTVPFVRDCSLVPKLHYWITSVIGYIFGLFLANIAVHVIGPQPALLYLSPCTVLPVTFLAWKKRELHILWRGPEASQTTTVSEVEMQTQHDEEGGGNDGEDGHAQTDVQGDGGTMADISEEAEAGRANLLSEQEQKSTA